MEHYRESYGVPGNMVRVIAGIYEGSDSYLPWIESRGKQQQIRKE